MALGHHVIEAVEIEMPIGPATTFGFVSRRARFDRRCWPWTELIRPAFVYAAPQILREAAVHFLWVIFIGFVAGLLARAFAPGPKTPRGFLFTTVLGILGAALASYLGQAIGFYHPGESAGLLGAVLGAFLVLFIWRRLVEAHPQVIVPATRRLPR